MITFLFFIVFLKILFLKALFRAKSIPHNLISNISCLFLSVFFINYHLINVLSKQIITVLILSFSSLDSSNHHTSSSFFQYFFAISSVWKEGFMIIIPGNRLGCVLSIILIFFIKSTITTEDRLLAKYWLRFFLFLSLVLAQVVSLSGCSSD